MNRSKQLPVARRRRGAALLAVWAAVLLAGFAQAQGLDRAAIGEYQVKAAFLYHFTKFIEWPAAAIKATSWSGCWARIRSGRRIDFLFDDKELRGKHFRGPAFQQRRRSARLSHAVTFRFPNGHR